MKKLSALGMAALGLAAVPLGGFCDNAAAGYAVSGLNGKVSGQYGDVDGENASVAEASLSMPLGNQIGMQADGLVGEIDPENIRGVGGHLFWRNSQLALLGITGTWAEYNDIEVERMGLEGEYYLNQMTFAAALGYQTGDIDDALYGGAEVRFYPTGGLLLSAAWSRADDQDLYGLGAEWQSPISMMSIFAQLAKGNDDYEHALGGVRFYLGERKTLVRRHREDDPPSMLLQSLTANLRAAQAAAKTQAIVPPPDPPAPPAPPQSMTPSGDSPDGDIPAGDSQIDDNPVDVNPVDGTPVDDTPEDTGGRGKDKDKKK